MRYRRIAACDRRQRVRRARSWVRSQIEGHAMGGDPIERRIAPSAECGYQYGGARGGGGFSPRGSAETITATLQDGLEVTVAELAGVLAEDLTGRATDVAQWAEGLLDEGAPGVARGVHAHGDDRDDGGSGQLAPRLATARTMAMLLRRYRDFDTRAVALEGAIEETAASGTVSGPSAGRSPSTAPGGPGTRLV